MDLDGLKDKATGLVNEHEEQVDKGIDKGGDFAKEKVSGHDEQIDKGTEKLQDLTGDHDAPTEQGDR